MPLDAINGLVRCVHPGIDGHVSFGTVLNVDYDAGLMQSYMDVEDLEGRVLGAKRGQAPLDAALGAEVEVVAPISPVSRGYPVCTGGVADVSASSISLMMQMVVNGLVRCVHPGIDGHVSFGTVLEVNVDPMLLQSYIDVEDLEGRVLNAIT